MDRPTVNMRKLAIFILFLYLTVQSFGIIAQLDSENADRNLTSIVTVLTDTPDGSNPLLCQLYVVFGDGAKNLDGTGGLFEFTLTVGGQTVQPSPELTLFGTEARSSVWTTQFPVPADAEVILRVKSPNAADTDVDVTAYLYDVFSSQVIEDAVWDASLTGASHNDGNSAGKRLRQVEHTTVLREEEQAQGGTSSTITLHDDASSINDFYDNVQVVIVGDTGIGQSRHVHAYIGSTRVASISPDWITTPDNTSDYVIMADSEKHAHELDDDAITAATISDSAWQELIELLFDFDATATYATADAGSVVKQIAGNTDTSIPPRLE